jgi:Myosin tail
MSSIMCIVAEICYLLTSSYLKNFFFTAVVKGWRNAGLYVNLSYRLASERDSAERDSRDKETRILNLSRQLEELQSHLAEVERASQQQQSELSELMSSKDDVGKNVCVTRVNSVFDCGFVGTVFRTCRKKNDVGISTSIHMPCVRPAPSSCHSFSSEYSPLSVHSTDSLPPLSLSVQGI